MSRKKIKTFLALGLIACMAGSVTVFAENAGESVSEKFPEHYERDDGQVKFSCALNLPEDFNEANIQKAVVDGLQCSDYEKMLAYLSGGRTIIDEYVYPAEDNIPEWSYCIFDDYTSMGAGGTSFYSTPNSEHYSGAFFKLSEMQKETETGQLEFMDAESCKAQLVEFMKNIGIEWNGMLSGYALGYEEASQWEEHLSQDGGLDEERYKQDWSSKDDAYLFYGYQQFQGLPVYHELMGIGGSMKYVNADNAAVQAIITADGIQRLDIHYLYRLSGTGEPADLKSFEEIADTVAFKLNQSLSGEQYQVSEASLMEMVRHSQDQNYEAFPIWYVEAASETGTTVVLVNAETAEEIYVQ